MKPSEEFEEAARTILRLLYKETGPTEKEKAEAKPIDFEKVLAECLSGERKFKGGWYYQLCGDMFSFYWKDRASVGRWIGDGATLHYAMKAVDGKASTTDEVIGISVMGMLNSMLSKIHKRLQEIEEQE